ncbi:hypothetical protein [Mycoplasmopsis bovigenitalium]|uniref:hypothetical protein n=1 Tax=Mycoplasmopsis bovigenitalium TaxID=2112 RepID=UPI000BBB396F|nr:hypothetical protein [Mycoplasmopsis bovigenitalium]
MKRKLLILAPILATSTVALAASCTNKNTQTDKELAELKLRISRLNSDYATEKSELQKQLEALKAKLSVEISDKDQKDSTIADLQRQLEELQKQVEAAEGKKVKKNNISARTLYGELVKFLAEDFPKAMQDQNPEAFNSNKDLFNKISESVKSSAEEFKTTPEDFKHLFTWQSAIFYNLNRAQLVAKFIDDPSNPVTVLTPKSELMDELFNWRIKDLDRIIQELSYDSYTHANKVELIAQVKDAKEKYQKAKDESSLFAHQIAKWFELERESSDETKGPIRDIVNFASPQYRELLPKFNLPAFKISLFPVYRQIVDDEFKAEVKKELLEINASYDKWLKNDGVGYIYSIRFNDLYQRAKVVADTIRTIATDPANINYYNEFETWNDLKKFVDEAKLTLFETFSVDYKNEKDKIDKIVDSEMDRNKAGSFASEFYKNYSNKNNDETNGIYDYLWKDFYIKYNKLIENINKMPKSTFTNSYARYAQYLTLKKQFGLSINLINLYANLGENIDDSSLKELLKWDNSEKFDKLIESEKETNAKAKKFISDITEGLIFNPLDENVNKEKVKTLFTKVLAFKTKLEKELSPEGDWIQYFAENDDIKNQLLAKFNEFFKLVNDANNKETIDSSEVKKINELAKKIWNEMVVGTASNTDNETQSIFGKFNKTLIKEGYSVQADDSDYKGFISIFEEILTTLNNILSKLSENHNATIEKLLKNIDTVTEYGKPWFWLSLPDGVRSKFQEELKQSLAKVSEITKNNPHDNESLKIEINNVLDKIGSATDGAPQKGLLTIIFDDLNSWESNIQNIENRKKRAIKTAKYIPGQEVFVLLRYWKNNNFTKTTSNLPDKNTHPDKVLSLFLNKLFNDFSNNSKYKLITSIKGDEDYFDTEYFNKDPRTPLIVYNEFKDLETKYAEDLLKFINSDSQDKLSAKKSLVESREKYYNYINSFKEKKIFPDTWVRFSGDKYNNSNEQDERFVSSTLLGLAADAYALSDMIDNFANKKFNEE